MSAGSQRDRLSIMREIHAVAKEMTSARNDADLLVSLIDKRQELIAEYDRLNEALPPLSDDQTTEVKRIAREVLNLDKIVDTALKDHIRNAKDELSQNTSQQKVMGYMNQAIASSGSYMDFKK